MGKALWFDFHFVYFFSKGDASWPSVQIVTLTSLYFFPFFFYNAHESSNAARRVFKLVVGLFLTCVYFLTHKQCARNWKNSVLISSVFKNDIHVFGYLILLDIKVTPLYTSQFSEYIYHGWVYFIPSVNKRVTIFCRK